MERRRRAARARQAFATAAARASGSGIGSRKPLGERGAQLGATGARQRAHADGAQYTRRVALAARAQMPSTSILL